MTVISAAIVLLLILDPFGNLVTINTLLSEIPGRKRQRIILREALIAYGILVAFLFGGNPLLSFFGVDSHTLRIAGGVILFLIALGMVFPDRSSMPSTLDAEPFIVPIAMPLIAGPSAIAALLVLAKSDPHLLLSWLGALTLAIGISAFILWASPWIFQRLGQRGALAIERLMGMLLIILSIQMMLDGIEQYLQT
ncbi:MarC family protein [Oscillatoria sp. CS-180]|uniref:MarC family protein n=1 Tax=Oscillatoria sp. CS-180 TaxID=3021720 RepID=UPI00232FE3D7|nr:MarC family protein [Oscillatoria sp. CS-180]MDB9529410.1 MarC family protein [Oscillatoria sp. CS-180]